MHCLSSPLAKLLLVGFTFSFVYHFCNGIRHLVWDTGRALDKTSIEVLAWATIIGSTLLTVLLWVAGYALKGGA